MKEELKNLIIRLQVSNRRVETLTENLLDVRRLCKQYEKCLTEELKISNSLADEVRLELLMEDAVKAQTE